MSVSKVVMLTRLSALCAVLAVALVACGNKAEEPARTPDRAAAKAADKAVAEAPRGEADKAATPERASDKAPDKPDGKAAQDIADKAPEAPSPQPDKATAPKAHANSIALNIDSGEKPDDKGIVPPAKPGKPLSVRVTPVGADGKPIKELEPVMGGLLHLIQVRGDFGYIESLVTTKLSDPERSTHVFKTKYTAAGRHMFYVIFKKKDEPTSVIPVFVQAAGEQAPPSDDLDKAGSTWSKGPLSGSLGYAPAPIKPGVPVAMWVTFKRGEKAVTSTAKDGVAARFFAVRDDMRLLVVGEAKPAPKAPQDGAKPEGKDARTSRPGKTPEPPEPPKAAMTFAETGRYLVFTVTDVGGKPVTALFALQVP